MKLLQNELLKLFHTKKPYIFFFVLATTTIITVYYYNSDTVLHTVIEAANAQSLPIVLKYSAAQFFTIFIAIYTAEIITNEYKIGALKLSLLQPAGRTKLLHSKVAAMLAFTVILTLFFILSAYAIGIASFGWDNAMIYDGMTYSTLDGLVLTGKAFGSTLLPLAAFGMIAVFIAIVSNNMTTTLAITIGISIFGEYLSALPHIKVFSIVNQIYFFSDYFVKTDNPDEMALSMGIIVAYIVIFYLLALSAFKKKDILF